MYAHQSAMNQQQLMSSKTYFLPSLTLFFLSQTRTTIERKSAPLAPGHTESVEPRTWLWRNWLRQCCHSDPPDDTCVRVSLWIQTGPNWASCTLPYHTGINFSILNHKNTVFKWEVKWHHDGQEKPGLAFDRRPGHYCNCQREANRKWYDYFICNSLTISYISSIIF